MTTNTEALRPDVSEMAVVHRVFRDTLEAAPQLVESATDDVRTTVIRNFYENVLALLHGHHDGEDEILYPILRERAADELELIDRINAQHHELDDDLAASRKALESWTTVDPSAQAEVAGALSGLHSRLATHLDEEEASIVPLCAEHMTIEEWGMLPAHAMAHYGSDKIWLAIGLIRERMSQEQRDAMLAHMPPPAVDMWTGFGERAFNDLMTQVGPPLR